VVVVTSYTHFSSNFHRTQSPFSARIAVLAGGTLPAMPRLHVHGIAEDVRKAYPREFALLHQLGGASDTVASEVGRASEQF